MFSPLPHRTATAMPPPMPCRRRQPEPRRAAAARTAIPARAASVHGPEWKVKYMVTSPDSRSLPDGCAMQEEGDTAIHVMCGGASFWVSDAEDFRLLGLAELGVVRQLPPGGLKSMRAVPADGSLFRLLGSEQVALMVGGARLNVASPRELSLVNVESRRLVVLPADAALRMPTVPQDGTTVKVPSASGHWDVLTVQGGLLHRQANPDAQTLRAAQAAPKSIFDVLGLAGHPSAR